MEVQELEFALLSSGMSWYFVTMPQLFLLECQCILCAIICWKYVICLWIALSLRGDAGLGTFK